MMPFPQLAEGTLLWQYLSPEERVLAGDGQFLLKDSQLHRDEEPTDYSYLVFPFAKLYEGFLKQLIRDLEIISEDEWASTYFRIGKAMSPNMAKRLGRHSVYAQISDRFGGELASRIWHTWKEGRNLVFHYFPHNYRALTMDQAKFLIRQIVETMDLCVRETHVRG